MGESIQETPMKPQKPQRSIRVAQEDWDKFKDLCEKHGTTVSEQITWFIERCNADGLPHTDDLSALTQTDKQVDALVDRLEARLDEIADRLEARLDQALPSPKTPKTKTKPSRDR